VIDSYHPSIQRLIGLSCTAQSHVGSTSIMRSACMPPKTRQNPFNIISILVLNFSTGNLLSHDASRQVSLYSASRGETVLQGYPDRQLSGFSNTCGYQRETVLRHKVVDSHPTSSSFDRFPQRFARPTDGALIDSLSQWTTELTCYAFSIHCGRPRRPG